MNYDEFLKNKNPARKLFGFKPLWLPDQLFSFQHYLADWSIRMGRCATFADCGLGKSFLELVTAENIVRKSNKNVLLLTPLAVGSQMVREGEKFGIEAKRSRDGKVYRGITITNYQQLDKFDPSDFVCVICDEASILKNSDGKTRKAITAFMSKVEYRFLYTATPSPNDYMELGCSSEALGVMPRNQMLGMYFTNGGETTQQWEIKGHARKKFWRWVGSWAKAIRRPQDLGYDDKGFDLPELKINHYKVKSESRSDTLIPLAAESLSEQRVEARSSMKTRCELVASLMPKKRPAVVWVHLNDEGNLLERMIDDAKQVKGSQSDDEKEEILEAFTTGQIKHLVTKGKITCFGLNWQHCADTFYFPSHSYEQFYQAIRRFWRFGQTKQVNCNLIYSEAESKVAANMIRKERASDEMFRGIIANMNEQETSKNGDNKSIKMKLPSWM